MTGQRRLSLVALGHVGPETLKRSPEVGLQCLHVCSQYGGLFRQFMDMLIRGAGFSIGPTRPPAISLMFIAPLLSVVVDQIHIHGFAAL